MTNGVLFGSFNPLHNSHVTLIEEGLKHFDVMHIFIRGTKDDIVDYDTKKAWLETLDRQLGGRLKIYPLTFPDGSFREDGSYDIARIFSGCETQAGVRFDGMISGGDKDVWLDTLKPAFPDRKFIVMPRNMIRSHAIRDNIEALRNDVPEYVYQTLKKA